MAKKVTPELKALTCGIIDRWRLVDAARGVGAARAQNAYAWKVIGNIPIEYRAGFLRMAREGDVQLTPTERSYLESSEKVPLI